MGKNNTKYTFNEVVEKARKIHGNKYDYIEDTYIDTSHKMDIICHEINALGKEHIISKQGCPFCRGLYKTTELIIAEFKQVHNDDYIYDNVIYVKNVVNHLNKHLVTI